MSRRRLVPTSPPTSTATIPTPTAERLAANGLKLANGRTAERRSIAPGGANRASCDVVYIGALPAADQRELTSRLAGSEIMTIAEADPLCRSQAMFCLIEAGNVVNFRLNVEAVARSGLRVDPRVLRLAVGQP